MPRTLLLLILATLSLSLSAQDDDDDKATASFCNDVGKKAIALYEKGTDKKKYKRPERLEFLAKAIEMEPEFAEAYLVTGLELAARCKLEERDFKPTMEYFYRAIGLCPAIHSEPYYYIGFQYYLEQKNDSAAKYLKKFIDFKDEDSRKFGKEWDFEMDNAKKMLKYAKAELSLRKNVLFDPKVVRGVSTERDEYLAYISPDDKSCYFVRKIPVKSRDKVFETDKEREFFMIAKRDKSGQFNEGTPMEPPFNTTEDNQGGCSISLDNRALYFAMMRWEGGNQPNCDLYVTYNNGEYWSDITKLSATVNDPKFWDSQPSIAADGVTLYFASDRPGGYGGIDLYSTRRDPLTGQWSPPVNLGPKINTPGDEKTPFIHSDSETLYFSSTGHTGFGGYDIFFARHDDKGEWTEPVNIGAPINGGSDDTGFFVSTDTKTGYFFSFEDEGKVSGRGVGRYDLYAFELYQEARPQQVALVRGAVKDEAGNAVSGAVVEVKDTKTQRVALATVDSSSGTYMMAVKTKNNYVITAKKGGIAFNTKVVKGEDLEGPISEPKQIDLSVKEAKAGSSFVIDNILYNTNSAELQKDSYLVLESFARYLKENPKITVEIQGHTDNVGNPKDNEALSSNRSHSVKKVLEEYGIDGKRIQARGFGASRPVADNRTEAGRAKNRRTEFLILGQ
jgi:outer membrane protein OmpA-like peptidoglycan-associated protein/tetratricopeptide (TPR) repeat protein